ncbi:thioredoxin family protein [Alloprevotella rava]|uniref:Thiol-disulfide isomerase/thioredoxin n=1 Tax=Alloprevotella rava TaxID=671218 RepID=A0A7W5UDR2_9BACT|nr:thioredoxin family protein [Alloprevotella rava]MBB3702183.1 thiol-disulfide isomerase/thioredoxin [Alloprevotella rava]
MKKRICIQLIALIAILCYPINLRADDYSLAPSTGQKVYVPIHAQSAKGLLYITNYGKATVQDFTYTLSFEGTILMEKKHIMEEPLPRMEVATVEIEVPPHSQLSETELQIEITKVNGEPNRATIPYANLPRVTVTQVPHRRVVVEEYTGMWCKYCPRGIALMENLENTYPDDFIGIAIHSSDPLKCSDYAWNISKIQNYPTLQMNRSRKLSSFIATDEFEKERAMGADMDIDVSAQWDKQKENITVIPSVTFRVSPKEATYAVAYVLTEDGMTKPTWIQYNVFSGDASLRGISAELDKFINAPSVIRGLPNNFTAIAAKSVYTPAEEDYIKTPIEVDKTQSFTHVFDISSNNLLQDKSKLKVCVLLINLNTKKIENAAKCSITDALSTGISSAAEAQKRAVETARYTLDGRRIQAPQKGINLVKYSDGRVRKEIITR